MSLILEIAIGIALAPVVVAIFVMALSFLARILYAAYRVLADDWRDTRF